MKGQPDVLLLNPTRRHCGFALELKHPGVASPQAAIHAGYDRAFDTILDANITTLIAGFALFWLGSGPIRGFAVTLCIGIFTTMFSAVLVSRALVNLSYGRQRKVESLSV